MTRIVGSRPNVPEDRIRAFFDRRAAHVDQADALAATVFTDRDTAELRHRAEAEIILPMLGLPGRDARILDVGCGSGRWAATLFATSATAPEAYVGVDFSAPLIALARKANSGSAASFFCASAMDLVRGGRAIDGPHSHILVIASAMYMGDDTMSALLEYGTRNLEPNGLLYLREGVTVTGSRLTLIEEPSAALGDRYTVIYRTPDEYTAMIEAAGLVVKASDELPAPHFQRHPETRHRYFICRRA